MLRLWGHLLSSLLVRQKESKHRKSTMGMKLSCRLPAHGIGIRNTYIRHKINRTTNTTSVQDSIFENPNSNTLKRSQGLASCPEVYFKLTSLGLQVHQETKITERRCLCHQLTLHVVPWFDQLNTDHSIIFNRHWSAPKGPKIGGLMWKVSWIGGLNTSDFRRKTRIDCMKHMGGLSYTIHIQNQDWFAQTANMFTRSVSRIRSGKIVQSVYVNYNNSSNIPHTTQDS